MQYRFDSIIKPEYNTSCVMHQYSPNQKRFAICFTCESLHWFTVYAVGVLLFFTL